MKIILILLILFVICAFFIVKKAITKEKALKKQIKTYEGQEKVQLK
jgi:uncharacterized protein YxeA